MGMTWPEENRAQGDFHGQVAVFKVATSGTKIKPSCVSTCTSDASTTDIEANSCYIDGICYADGDGVPEFSLQYTRTIVSNLRRHAVADVVERRFDGSRRLGV